MKRLLWLTSLIILVTMINVSAETDIKISASRANGEGGSILHNILVKISGEVPNSNLMMVVKAPDNSVIGVDQGYVDEKGNISFTFLCDAQGTYNGYINTENQGIKTSFAFAISSDYQSIIDELNGADESNIESRLDAHKDTLLLDSKYYTQEKKSQIALNFLQKKGTITILNVNEIFDKSIIETCLYSNNDTTKKVEVLEYYDLTYFGIIDQSMPKNLYKDFLGLTNEQKENVFTLIKTKMPALDEFRNAFNEAVVMTAFGMLDDSKLDTFIISNIDYVAFEGYESSTLNRRKQLINIVKQPPNENSVSELIAAYNDAVEDLDNPPVVEEQEPTPDIGDNGGGGGGGGIPMPVKPSVEEKEENKEDEVLEEKPVINIGFSDIDGVKWAKDAITNLSNKGIINGKEAGKFYPNDNVTRAEFITMIIKAFVGVDEDAVCEFTDLTADDWSYQYVATGYSKGIVNGLDDNSFGKNTNITREDMATILYRALSFTKAVPLIDKVENNIPDFETISSYAQNSVLMLSEMGIVNGMEDGSFVPKKNATRAEAAVIINNAMGVVGK